MNRLGKASQSCITCFHTSQLYIMIKRRVAFLFAGICFILSCQLPESAFQKDLQFLQKYDSVIVLRRENSRVVVSPKYQAKVFTSTAGDGSSNGWINYKVFEAEPDPHMNAFGGENCLWLGPEGGPFSLFYPRGFVMNFDNWRIPSAFDTEPWELVSSTDTMAALKKDMKLPNYSGTELTLTVDRKIRLLDQPAIEQWIGTRYNKDVKAVGYTTENNIVNKGTFEWTDSTGMPCLWILNLLPPSARTTVIIPFKKDSVARPANTSYFGDIPANRLKYRDSTLFYKADGMLRSKLSIPARLAKNRAGSYDAGKKMLTITIFDVNPGAKYLNQEWDTKKPPFVGDAVNAYNDGPLEDGRQLGPFYVLESVSPAAFLAPGQSLTHTHSVFHFSGSEKDLDPICRQTLGVSLEQVKSIFK